MALKQLMLSKKLGMKRGELEALMEEGKELEHREAELEQSLEEAKTAEETDVVEEAVGKLEEDKTAYQEKKEKLEQEIKELEKKLEEENRKTSIPVNRPEEKEEQTRTMGGNVIRRGAFKGRTAAERDAVLAREEVREFLERARELKGQQRAASGSELLIPDVLLELLRDTIDQYSKLIQKVRLRALPGTARQNIAGTIPEAVWTEAVGALNELQISFNQVEVDGYKVGGFIPIENSTLEDAENPNLADEILYMLGQAIGYAVDKAILYGTGRKMPIGIVTRLAQTAKPDSYSKKARPWENLSASNILKLNLSTSKGTDFWQSLIEATAAAKENFSNGEMFWVMNRATKMKLLSKAIAFNAAAALTSSVNNTMPIIGGEIITLPFMADGDILGGFGMLYLLAERKGGTFAVSEHVRFIEDQTVFKGTARYDGVPVIPEGFVLINFINKDPQTAVSFAEDEANKKEESGNSGEGGKG